MFNKYVSNSHFHWCDMIRMLRSRFCANIAIILLIITFIFVTFLQFKRKFKNISLTLIESGANVQLETTNSSSNLLRKKSLQEMCKKYEGKIERDNKLYRALHINRNFGQPFIWCRVPKASSSSWVKFFTDMYYKDLEPYHGCLREGGHKTIHIEWNKILLTG